MDEKILQELVNGILSIMESKVIRIVLYGSVARGTNTTESDVDVALFMNGNLDRDTVFSVIDIDYDVFKKWEKVTPFYKNVAQEGIVLWKAA